MFKIILVSIYSVLISPFLVLSSRYSFSVFQFISKPLLSGPLSDSDLTRNIQKLIYQLNRKDLSEYEFISSVSEKMKAAHENGELDQWLNLYNEGQNNVDVTLARCLFFEPLKWWYLKIHFMKEGNRHGLQAHRNVLSTQVIARGRLKVQEFDRVSLLQPPTVKLKLRNAGDAVVGATLMSTDEFANVHGFEPYSEGAVRFQFYLRGHTSFLNRFPKRGRLYVDIKGADQGEDIIEATLGRAGRPGES